MNAETQQTEEPDFMTIAEVARKFRCSVDTIRRHVIADKLRGIVWIDPLSNGKLRATRESVEAFITAKLAATQEVLRASSKKARAA